MNAHVNSSEAFMPNAYTRPSTASQDLIDPHFDDVEILSAADILPEEFGKLAAEDQTVGMACAYSRHNVFLPREIATQTAILLAWEQGKISGFEAFDHLEINEAMPYDQMLGCYLAYVRACALGEAA
jgi:hypothetical protein